VGVASRLIIAVEAPEAPGGAGEHLQQQERIQLENRRLTTIGRTGRIVCFVCFVRKNSDVTHPVFFVGSYRLTTTCGGHHQQDSVTCRGEFRYYVHSVINEQTCT